MSTDIRCDRCGTTITTFRRTMAIVRRRWAQPWEGVSEYDLCKDCGESLERFLDTPAADPKEER